MYLPPPTKLTSGMQHKASLKRSTTGIDSKFSFSKIGLNIKAKELSMPYYLPKAGGG